jgi:DNA modification methylase
VTAHIIRGDALALPLPDSTVDLCVTSPPYFGLRSYTDGGVHYGGQIGAEPTPVEFVDALIAATAEMVRVLKPSGSIFVNLGDKYSGAQAQNFGGTSRAGDSAKVWAQTNPRNTGIPNKSLMGIPWRYALRCIDDLGLILRAEIIWDKPNGLPESVTDRVRRSHEQWFHFVRQPRYFSGIDHIREEHAPAGLARRAYAYSVNDAQRASNNPVLNGAGNRPANPLGKLPGSVWTIPTQPLIVPPELGVDHFAAYPCEWPRRFIRGWSPSGVCTACGEGRRPVSLRTITGDRGGRKFNVLTPDVFKDSLGREGYHSITGEACACPEPTAPTTPAVVVDPFGGTGTTALVAKVEGRTGVSVDMSWDYSRLAAWRTTDPAQIASAMQVDKPAKPIEGQLDMFGEMLA